MDSNKDKYIEEALSPIIEKIEDWPLNKIKKQKDQFLNQIIDKTKVESLESFKSGAQMLELLKKIHFQERNRLEQEPWKSDTPEEHKFWKKIKKKLLKISDFQDENEIKNSCEEIFDKILRFYAEEIVANFKTSSYKKAKKLLPFGFSRVFNPFPFPFKRLINSRKHLYKKLKITGEIDSLRELTKKGTVIIVPTHFSNLDSPTIGLSLDGMGLPSFTYGAGINLFTNPIISSFMNNLGSYKVDRRRKNDLYLNLLKNYSTIGLTKGIHSLFFPGGTRSRSGKIETKIKMGLLGTAIEAQQINFKEQNGGKIFIVPMVINYHFIFEAPSLINDHLKLEGKELYLADGKSKSRFKTLKLISKIITKNPSLTISIGKPMDVIGNYVNPNGESFNHLNQKVEIESYFSKENIVSPDKQRDRVYTKHLSEKIVQSFLDTNVVLSSHLVAFVAFQIISKKQFHLSLFDLVRLPEEDSEISIDHLKSTIERIKIRLFEMESNNKINLSPQIRFETDDLISHALKHLGCYHSNKVLKLNKNNNLISGDMRLLYFYHNRTKGYDLESYI